MKRMLVLGLLLGAGCCWGAESKRPNFLIFITDDESWLERSAYGWSTVPTPHFDRIAKEGVLFTRGYTSAPSCAPSRAALLTGRNFWELEQGAFIQACLPAKFACLPDLLEAGGYHAGYTGKGWGPGVLDGSGRTRNPAGQAYNGAKVKVPEPGISAFDYAANFEAFLDARPEGKPFYFWVGCVEPHSPCDKGNDKRLADKYGRTLADVKVPGFIPDTPGVRRSRANMLYEVCHADEDLGRILAALGKRGELDNTLVVVTGDNGTQVLRSKANVYDWGVHVPLAMRWPARVKPGRRVDDFVNFIDIAPTFLQAAGLPVPGEMSGRSLLGLLESSASGRIDPARGWTAVGLEWHGELEPVNLAGRMIRDERYAYIVNYGAGPRRTPSAREPLPDADYEVTARTGSEGELVDRHPKHPAIKPFVSLLVSPRPREELYDCVSDPWQLTNLVGSAEHAAAKERLKAQLEAYQRQTRDPRATGDMKLFEKTRAFVQGRKKNGYKD